MFIGEYEHNIDAKGRAIIPSKFREELGESFVIAKELDGCLGVYKLDVWLELMEKFRKLPTTNKTARDYKRFKMSGAHECEPDGNGRIMIPAHLREFAGITKEIISIGDGDKVEIWDKQKWLDYNSCCEFDEAKLESLQEYGI